MAEAEKMADGRWKIWLPVLAGSKREVHKYDLEARAIPKLAETEDRVSSKTAHEN